MVDLSSDFSSSLFNNSSLQGTSHQILGGVIGANNSGNPSDVWGTQLRTSNIGNPALAGSTAPGGLTTAEDTTAAQQLSTLNAPAAGTGVLDSSKTWEAYVEPTFSIHSFWGNAGFNPDSAVSTSTVLYEDLWMTSDSSSRGTAPFTYVGYFTLDLTGGSPNLTFTSTNVPASLTKPIIISIGKVGSTVTVVSSNAVPTFNYQLQYTASLNPTNWISVGSSVVAGARAGDQYRYHRNGLDTVLSGSSALTFFSIVLREPRGGQETVRPLLFYREDILRKRWNPKETKPSLEFGELTIYAL